MHALYLGWKTLDNPDPLLINQHAVFPSLKIKADITPGACRLGAIRRFRICCCQFNIPRLSASERSGDWHINRPFAVGSSQPTPWQDQTEDWLRCHKESGQWSLRDLRAGGEETDEVYVCFLWCVGGVLTDNAPGDAIPELR